MSVSFDERDGKRRSVDRFRSVPSGAYCQKWARECALRVMRADAMSRKHVAHGAAIAPSHSHDWTEGMAERNWTKSVAQAAAARDRVRGAVKDVATALPALITNVEAPRLPLRERWDVGLGQVLRDHPGLPEKLRGIVGHLDRLGRVQISPDAIGLDAVELRWEKVDEIRFGPAMDLLASQALQYEAERMTSLLPPVPGRKLLVHQAIGVLAALCLAVAGPEGDAEPQAGGDPDHAALAIPLSITYRSLGRRKNLTPGVFATLVAASTPGVSEAIAAIAQERGIRVTAAPAARSHAQALAMRRMAAAVAGRLVPRNEPPALDSADDGSVGHGKPR